MLSKSIVVLIISKESLSLEVTSGDLDLVQNRIIYSWLLRNTASQFSNISRDVDRLPLLFHQPVQVFDYLQKQKLFFLD